MQQQAAQRSLGLKSKRDSKQNMQKESKMQKLDRAQSLMIP